MRSQPLGIIGKSNHLQHTGRQHNYKTILSSYMIDVPKIQNFSSWYKSISGGSLSGAKSGLADGGANENHEDDGDLVMSDIAFLKSKDCRAAPGN